jgi:putative salt-induced outer membrane protein
MITHRILISAMIVVPFSLFAQETEDEGPWAGKVNLGYLATSGNTENSTMNSGFEISYTTGKWTHFAEAFAIKASESEITSAEAYDLGWKSERQLSDKDFLFGRLQWRKDRFGGYAAQFSQTLGYGRRIIDNDVHKLNGELGAGARQSELQDGATGDEAIFRGGLYYTWQFSETAQFRQDLTAEIGDKNTYSESVTALSAKLVGDLALVASFTIKNNSDVPPLTEKADTYTALSLEYTF